MFSIKLKQIACIAPQLLLTVCMHARTRTITIPIDWNVTNHKITVFRIHNQYAAVTPGFRACRPLLPDTDYVKI